MTIENIERIEPDQVLEKGYLMKGRLPSRRVLMVVPLLWGRALLGLGPMPPMEDVGVFDSTWEFPSTALAIAAFLTWNPEKEEEPQGWDRHPGTMRYRMNGDPDLEYVKIDLDKPLKEEILRAVQACNRSILATASIEETDSTYAKDGPDGTKSFVISWSHDHQGKPCHHTDCALVYLDRCIILTMEDMIQLVKDPRKPATILQRLAWLFPASNRSEQKEGE